MLLWVPIFAYNDGASPELIDDKSGILVPDKKHKTLVEYFSEFQKTIRDREQINKSIKEKLNNKQ